MLSRLPAVWWQTIKGLGCLCAACCADAGNVPWSQLVAVVSSAALEEPSSPGTQLQPQVRLQRKDA